MKLTKKVVRESMINIILAISAVGTGVFIANMIFNVEIFEMGYVNRIFYNIGMISIFVIAVLFIIISFGELHNKWYIKLPNK